MGRCGEEKTTFGGALKISVSQPLDAFVGHLDGADERFAFVQSVAIRAAGDEQTMLIG